MRLVSNSGRIARKAISMWMNYLGIACLVAPEAIYYFFERDTNPRIWWLLGLGLIIGSIVGRLIDQGIDRDRLRSPSASMMPTPVQREPGSMPRIRVMSVGTSDEFLRYTAAC